MKPALKALTRPMCITEGGLQVMIAIASRDEFFAEARHNALAARRGERLLNTRNVEVRPGGVAVIPVTGPLFRHANILTEISGATSYAELRQDFQAALDSPLASSIVFEIDSPGGEVTGCAEFAGAVFAARGKKPIVAYAGGLMASAAYWIGSAADRIVAHPTAEIGSIGVRAAVFDDSKALEMEGIKKLEIVSSQSPLKKFDVESADDKARLQVLIDKLAGIFVADVARNRGVSADIVLERFGKGDVMLAADAVSAGLADQLGDFEGVVQQLAVRADAPKTVNVTAAKAINVTRGKS